MRTFNPLPFFTILFLSIVAVKSKAANDTIWFDNNWQELPSKASASFFSVTNFDESRSKYVTLDYFISGNIQMTKEFSSIDPEIADGPAVWYYESGAVSSKKNYEKGKLQGPASDYFRDGKLKMEGNFINDLLDGTLLEYTLGEKIFRKGTYSKGKKIGTWDFYDLGGTQYATKSYENGKLKSINCFTCDSTLYYDVKFEEAEGNNNVSTNFEITDPADFSLYEPYIKNNLKILQANPTRLDFALGWSFTVTYASNAPGLSKLAHTVDKFTMNYLNFEGIETYQLPIQQLMLLGLSEYIIENKGKKFNESDAKYAEVLFLVNAYENYLKINPSNSIVKLDKLIKKRDAGKLKKFIRKY